MTIEMGDLRKTGVPFIDDCHPVIAAFVKMITGTLKEHKDIDYILAIFDTLIQQTDSYLQSKNDCAEKYDCQDVLISNEPLECLIKLRADLAKNGHQMEIHTIILEVQEWAKTTIFEKDIICGSCIHFSGKS